MQSRRWQHGNAGELGVFGATRYFAGQADHCANTVHQRGTDRLTQAKMVMRDEKMVESFRGHDTEQLGLYDRRQAHEHDELQLELAKPAGKSKFAAFMGFIVSPSPGASFRRRPPLPPTTKPTAEGDESVKVSLSSSTTSSGESTDDLVSPAASVQLLEGIPGYDLHDLGAATGDRRLQGVKVVRGRGGDEERWVVRCAPFWRHQEEHRAELFDPALRDDHRDHVEEEGEDCINPCTWDSDSSSDLFDLDIGCFDDL